MAGKRSRGRGWIRLLRLISWIVFVVMLIGGIGIGIGLIALGNETDLLSYGTIAPSLSNQSTLGMVSMVQGGWVPGITVMIVSAVIGLIFLAMMNVFLDMAENVRRISVRLSRRSYEVE